jgi:hypothetical protein
MPGKFAGQIRHEFGVQRFGVVVVDQLHGLTGSELMESRKNHRMAIIRRNRTDINPGGEGENCHWILRSKRQAKNGFKDASIIHLFDRSRFLINLPASKRREA